MASRHEARAQHVVTAFKELLDEQALEAISKAQFEELELLVREAVSEEWHNAAEQLEEVVRRFRAEAELPELGL